jgi:hypothetical protein
MKQLIASVIELIGTTSTTLVGRGWQQGQRGAEASAIATAEVPPVPHLIERCWRVLTANGHIVTCGIYWTHDAPGVELRAGHDHVSFFRSERVASNEVARALAMSWLEAVRERGGFDELEPANVTRK